jgi:hypothetical protein
MPRRIEFGGYAVRDVPDTLCAGQVTPLASRKLLLLLLLPLLAIPLPFPYLYLSHSNNNRMDQKTPDFFARIRQLVADDRLDDALRLLRSLLENSPLLDEAIVQSARFQDIRKLIRLGTVGHAEANLTKNQIRAALLDLLREIEENTGNASTHPDAPALREEVGKAVSIVESKNVVINSTITAGGDVHIGDTETTDITQTYTGSGDNVGRDKIVHHHYGDRKIPHALTSPPFLPEIFLGREDDLRRIHDKLFAPGGNLLLLVNGEGGVGKTSVASKYYHRYQHEYEHVAWVLSQKSIAGALLLLALPLGLQFDPADTTEQRLDKLLAALAGLRKPCLLVIDNANEPDDLERHYLRLRSCANFHLLLTTRIGHFAKADSHLVGGLPKGEALEMFEKHYRPLDEEERKLFYDIRTAVGENTLVLELFAKNLREINRLRPRYALADLLTDLQSRGVLGLTRQKEVYTEYHAAGGQLRRETPEAVIAAMYDLGGLPREEVALLSIFAVLPAESIDFETLDALLPGESDELEARLLALAQKGWIEFNEEAACFQM